VDEIGQLLLPSADLVLDRLALAHAIAMLLRDDRQLRLAAVALRPRLARLGVGPLPLWKSSPRRSDTSVRRRPA